MADEKAPVTPTVEDLTAQVATLTTSNATLTEQVNTLTAENAALKAVNASLQEEVVAANAKVVAPKAAATKPVPVTHIGKTFVNNGTTYSLAYPKTVFEGNAINADNIVADPKLQDALIAAKHSIIKAQA